MISSEKKWYESALIYEVYIDKFAGNLKNFTTKLEYLQFLGVDCIHLLPHYPSSMIDDGYDISDYKNVRPALGTLEDFKKFTAKAHEKGIRVVVDFVLNHTSIKHPWFIEASSSKNNSKRDFYLWSKTGSEYKEARNVFSNLKLSNWIYSKANDDYYFSTFYPEQADLNWQRPEVFNEMMKIMDFWMDIGVDGFRLDAVAHIIKKEGFAESSPDTHILLKKIRSFVEQKRSDVVLIAEVNESIEKTQIYFGNGDECHLLYNFPYAGKVFVSLMHSDKEIFEKFAQTLKDIPDNCQWLNFLRHHDEMSLKTLTPTERSEMMSHFDPEKKYGFGGKGLSLRMSTMFQGKKEKIIEALTLLLKTPGAKVLYYGDEIGMQNESLLPTEKDSRRALRGAFDWGAVNTQRKNPDSLLNKIAEIIKEK